ncbi:MAG: trypsin-like serine protease [Actinomycetota bacterium]|nr:trypsin-like serine protease [Actinomycetota bacterium]
MHDAGVVVLNQPFSMPAYGKIPTLDYLDRYQGDPHHLLEVVGYGLTKSGPFTEEGGDTRLKGDVKINSLNASPPDTFILLSNNPGLPHKGGTCFGDSGGPTFDDTNSRLVVAVTSFGESETCSGIGGAYRLDQPDDLAFLRSFGIRP